MIISIKFNHSQYRIYRNLYKKCIFREFATAKENTSTVDENELHNLSKYAETWWNPKGNMTALHRMNELRVPFIRDNLINIGKTDPLYKRTSSPLHGVNILEVGCGGGILTEALARIGASVTGLDIAQELIAVATEHADKDPKIKGRIKYETASIEDFAEKHSSSFDAIICSEVIEHVTQKDLFVKAAVQTIKPGGSIFITTIEKTFISWVGAIIIGEYVLNLLPRGTHQYEKFISPHEMQRLLEIHNCDTRIIQGMFYNPFNKKWSWSSSKLTYGLHAVKAQE